MAEEKKSAATKPAAKAKREKPPAIEDKPFNEFIEQHFIPGVQEALADQEIESELNFTKAPITASGMNSNEAYWQLQGDIGNNRQFYLYFLEEDIKGKKAFAYATDGGKPSTIESFMIDERKITLDLLVLYTLQRLDGQKWLKKN